MLIRRIVLVFFLLSLSICSLFAQSGEKKNVPHHISQPVGPPPQTFALKQKPVAGRIYRIEARPDKGFNFPYFLAIPKNIAEGTPLLVEPNNDGQIGAPFETHLYWASIINEQSREDFGNALGAVTLTPAFPRPAIRGENGNLYIHALSRAALISDQEKLRRPDLQLLAMVDDARRRLAEAGHSVPADFLLWGFSAAGDFVTRMTFLYPERVRAVAAGGLGGLPILPVGTYDGKPLTYPVGTGDFRWISGKPFRAGALRKTPILLFQGEKDDNDSVPEGLQLTDPERYGSDSYSYVQAKWVNETLGAGTVERVGRVRLIYQAFGMRDFAYRIVPGIAHKSAPLKPEVRRFFACVLKSKSSSCAGNFSIHAN